MRRVLTLPVTVVATALAALAADEPPPDESDVSFDVEPPLLIPNRSDEPLPASAAATPAPDVDLAQLEKDFQRARRNAAGVERFCKIGALSKVEAEQRALRAIRFESDLANARLAQVKEELVAWVKTLMSAAVYAVLIVTFGFQVARVEGQSMAPTLEDQDRLIVNKLVYRISDPRRGDIVMLYYPLNPDKSFVKRVIAEEGDTVRIVDGRVYVNDIPLKDDYVASEYRSHDDWGPQVIPEGYYFVMGDHRNNSSDSRHWGMVPKKYIIGKVQLRWWPVPTARVF